MARKTIPANHGQNMKCENTQNPLPAKMDCRRNDGPTGQTTEFLDGNCRVVWWQLPLSCLHTCTLWDAVISGTWEE